MQRFVAGSAMRLRHRQHTRCTLGDSPDRRGCAYRITVLLVCDLRADAGLRCASNFGVERFVDDPGSVPTTGPPRSHQPKMETLAKQLAAALASTDGIP